ncbi:MAG: tRNA pseudouridine(55) synthase TruB [Firmicutes bacterium]|nr:tRNA pseudouridine(55) synthase TruB [Bacillota bacterium]
MNAILNILKPSGMTSHDVVSFARNKLPGIKVGHAGTLDPAASGVLPLCLGKATRISSFLLEGDKGYRGEIMLGIATDTFDGDGRITCQKPLGVPGIDPERVRAVLRKNIGRMEQEPPSFSAIRYRGRRSYEWARKGKTIKLPPRKVSIYSLKLVQYMEGSFPRIIFDVKCSHGTYIRSLAVKIGEDLGCPAHLSFLLRTSVGPFTIDRTVTIEDLGKAVEENGIGEIFLPIDIALLHMPEVVVVKEALRYLVHGNYLYANQVSSPDGEPPVPGKVYRVYGPEREFWGLGEWTRVEKGIMFKPTKLLRLC